MGYWEAYRARLDRNQADLLKLAADVMAADNEVEVYRHHDEKRAVSSITFFKGEEINSVSFHEVPYRWSGCGYGEHNGCHSGGDNVSMPFDVNDVLTTFKPVKGMRKSQVEVFKTKDQYLKWCSWLTKIKQDG